MDPYVDKLGLKSDLMGLEYDLDKTITKSYTFEKYDKDIIESPISHKIEKCYLDLEISNVDDIGKIIKFLENLKPALITYESKQKILKDLKTKK
jgi:hypothetical protein